MLMRIVLFLVAAAGLYIFYGLVTRREGRTPGRAWLATALVLVGGSVLIGDLYYHELTRLTGIPNVARLMYHLFGGVAAAYAAQCMVAYWVYPTTQARQQALRRTAVSATIALAMTVLFFSVETGQETERWQERHGHIPQIAAYIVLFNIAIGWMLHDVRRASWRYSSHIRDRPRVRLSLRLFSIGAFIGLIYSATHIANVIAIATEKPIPTAIFLTLVNGAQNFCLLFIAAAAVVPGIGAAAARSRRALLTARLQPLWSAVRDGFPTPRSVDRDGPDSTAQAIMAGLTAKNDEPVHRMVIDIRDGYLEMRPWVDADVAEAARRLAAEQTQLHGDDVDATIEATTVACALRDKAADRRPVNQGELPRGADDMSMEARWLVRVSTAMRQSRIVQLVLQDDDSSVPVTNPGLR
ncbi:MAB_1171c family putative transporter [Salinispora vitiensis]|uniref:MAB_1171c family putative transporter n=1 Tax=Salinispora vitiensis TaxID=999544 RepID=UPI0003656AF7|nr:MAB_1171c family putative transporter [Salinispora vitiensis]